MTQNTSTFDAVNQRIQSARSDYEGMYTILAGLGLVAFGIWLGSLFFTDGYNTNVYTELLSVVATIVVVDQLNRRRDRSELKSRLFNELRSPATGQGTAALAWLRREGWLSNDSLINANLHRVNWERAYVGGLNLEGANLNAGRLTGISNQLTNEQGKREYEAVNLKGSSLRHTHMEKSVLIGADFSKANMFKVHLQDAVLVDCNLQIANLHSAHLQNANLSGSNFTGVDLRWADLQGANLAKAQLRGAVIKFADLNNCHLENTILPDGEDWTNKTDMGKYTDENHPEFAATLAKINTIRAEMNLYALIK